MVAAAAKMSVSNLYLIESQKAQALPKETLEALSDAIGCDFVSQVYRIVCSNEHMSSTPSSQSWSDWGKILEHKIKPVEPEGLTEAIISMLEGNRPRAEKISLSWDRKS